jgi:dTDP-glucose 4,6-dehydratase
MPPPIPTADLDAILAATAPLWAELRGQRLFLTGGTGFFGCWLVESFLHIDRALALDARLTVLSRNPAAFLHKLPHLRSEPALTLLAGDIRTFDFPTEPHSRILHAATDSTSQTDPADLHDTIVAGTARVLAFARATGASKLLFVSSGGVYGPQPAGLTHIPEDLPPQPATPYGRAKLEAEQLCLAAPLPIEVKIARPFAFLGPHLPLDAHFAAGNFLSDALAPPDQARPIRIASDGLALRSYLYPSDLASWLWTILLRGATAHPYNVGSDQPVTILELAETIRRTLNPALTIEVAQPPDATRPPHRYIPSTARARTELDLHQSVTLEDALRRTAAWHRLK